MTQGDKAILAATDECLAGKSISDATWAEVAKHVTDPEQQFEFIIAMGNWMMFSLLFRNLRIPLAEGVMVWPPDGLASPAAEGVGIGTDVSPAREGMSITLSPLADGPSPIGCGR